MKSKGDNNEDRQNKESNIKVNNNKELTLKTTTKRTPATNKDSNSKGNNSEELSVLATTVKS